MHGLNMDGKNPAYRSSDHVSRFLLSAGWKYRNIDLGTRSHLTEFQSGNFASITLCPYTIYCGIITLSSTSYCSGEITLTSSSPPSLSPNQGSPCRKGSCHT